MQNHTGFTRKVFEEVGLFINGPLEYILLFTSPNNKYVSIAPFNPKNKEKGKELVRKLHDRLPGLKVNFFGSSALEVPGRGDIDLVAECKPQDFDKYLPWLTEMFGRPVKTTKRLIGWDFKHKGVDVELILIDPTYKLFRWYFNAFYTLSKKEVKEKYIKLKFESDGISIREYEKRKLKFFRDLGIND